MNKDDAVKNEPAREKSDGEPKIKNDVATEKKRKKSHKSFRQLSLLLAIIFVAFISGMLGAGLIYKIHVNDVDFSTTSSEDGNVISSGEEKSISKIVETVGPSVVSIAVETKTNTIFGAMVQSGAGTGMIVSSDGYVMTNKHVVGNAKSVTVTLENGTVYDNVEVIGSDPLNDVAFVKIKDVKDLPVVTLGDSGTVKVGQQVVAIGNALGQYQNTVTTGILSGIGRPITASDNNGSGQENLVDLLQTDAAINSGNSGGPLVNSAGQVIGINTAIAVDANNIGFAIPINATKGLLAELLKTGTVTRAFLGVNFVNITPAVTTEYRLPVTTGAYVFGDNAVSEGSPAQKAGIQASDVITKINDNQIGQGQGLSTIIGMYRPGDEIKLTIIRDGKTITKEVTLAAYQSQSATSSEN